MIMKMITMIRPIAPARTLVEIASSPSDIETIEGQDILTNEFNMGAYALVVAENETKKAY